MGDLSELQPQTAQALRGAEAEDMTQRDNQELYSVCSGGAGAEGP